MNYKLHKTKSYPWGYEAAVAITLDDGSIHEEIIRFSAMPDKEMIAKAVQERAAKLAMATPEPDEMLSKEEVERTLRDKGYLTEEQEWEDLTAKEARV